MKKLITLCILLLVFAGCKKEQVNQYEINEQHIQSQANNKSGQKSDIQFISIAWSDLVGRQISAAELSVLTSGYNAVGDKKLIIDRIIRKLLSVPGLTIPSEASMRADIKKFVEESFQKFFVRQPSEMESWYFQKIINEEADIKPEDIYYVLMSAEEYRYF